jgi:hypothetical protein
LFIEETKGKETCTLTINNNYILLSSNFPDYKKVIVLFYLENDNIVDLFNQIKLSKIQEKSLFFQKSLKIEIRHNIIRGFFENQIKIDKKRLESIANVEKVQRNLQRLFLRDYRIRKEHNDFVKSDIIPSMDGSTLLWLGVILSAKKDFLKGYNNPKRISEWDLLNPRDLQEEDGTIKRGNEEPWSYITARDFLFDDNYRIDLGDPYSSRDKTVNCKELLEFLIEICNSKELDSSLLDPSMKHLRRSLAQESGDPKLVSIYSE